MSNNKLVCLIASHLNCNERMKNFDELLDSIHKQKNFDELIDNIHKQKDSEKNIYISLSADNNIDTSKIIKKINSLGFTLLFSETKLSQFQHYSKLINIVNEQNIWIIFSDDDDVWDNYRLATYEKILNHDNIKNMTFIKIIPTAILSQMKGNKYTFSNEDNYVNYCIPIKYVKMFFDSVTENILLNKFCDVFFVTFITTYGAPTLQHAELDMERPIYFWRNVDYDRVCNKDKIVLTESNCKDTFLTTLDLFIARYCRSLDSDNVNNFLKFTIMNSNLSDVNELSAFGRNEIIKIFNEYSKNHCFRITMPKY